MEMNTETIKDVNDEPVEGEEGAEAVKTEMEVAEESEVEEELEAADRDRPRAVPWRLVGMVAGTVLLVAVVAAVVVGAVWVGGKRRRGIKEEV